MGEYPNSRDSRVKSQPCQARVKGCEVTLVMNCRAGCGACCITPSISSPIPGMPQGKAAGERCLHLSVDYLCGLFGMPERPAVCAAFVADREVCGDSREEAVRLLGWLEQATAQCMSSSI